MKSVVRSVPALIAAALALTPAFSATVVSVTELGTLPGDFDSTATGINNRSEIVGASLQSGPVRAFLWRDGVMSEISNPDYPDADRNEPIAINNKGQVLGVTFRADLTPIGVYWLLENVAYTPFIEGVWPSDINDREQSVGYDYSTFPGNGFLFQGGDFTIVQGPAGATFGPVAVNNGGQVVGVLIDQEIGYPAIWTRGTTSRLEEPTDSYGCLIRDINNGGLVVGDCLFISDFMFVRRAAVWENGRIRLLPHLPGTATASPRRINERGQIVGEAATADLSRYHAVLWEGDEVFDLGPLPGDTDAGATDINDRGQVVGWSAGSDSRRVAVRWDLRGSGADPSN